MNAHLNIKLEKILSSIIKIRPMYSYEKYSSRIEGQFGGETMEEKFSEIFVYIQCTPSTQKYELLKDIVSRCYYLCKKINAGDSVYN